MHSRHRVLDPTRVLQRRTLTRNVDCPRVDEDSEDLIDRKRERSLSFEASRSSSCSSTRLTATNMARSMAAARRRRLRMGFPHGHRKTTTLVAGLRLDGMIAPMVLDGPINGDWFEAMSPYLVPTCARRHRHHGQPLQPQAPRSRR